MGVGLRGEGEGGKVSAVWGGGDVDVVVVVGGMAWDGEERAEEGWVSGWIPWLETGEGGSGFEACCDGEGRPSSEANPDVRSMAPAPRASIPLQSFSVRSRQLRGLKDRRSFAERETGTEFQEETRLRTREDCVLYREPLAF